MLEGKTAFVTGAARGIGKAVACVLAKYGADVVVADILEDESKATAREIAETGRKSIGIKIDVANKESVKKAVDQAMNFFNRIDILANCAGVVTSYLLSDLPEDVWDRVMSINAKGTFLVGQAVSNVMIRQKYGRIVNISSQAAKVGEAGNGAYCASKAAVSLLTQVQALELAEHGITSNCVCPGYTNTIIMQKVFKERGPLEGKTPKEYEMELLSNVPLKRMANPSEIGELVAFLASDKAGYITGTSHTIAGGKVLD